MVLTSILVLLDIPLLIVDALKEPSKDLLWILRVMDSRRLRSPVYASDSIGIRRAPVRRSSRSFSPLFYPFKGTFDPGLIANNVETPAFLYPAFHRLIPAPNRN